MTSREKPGKPGTLTSFCWHLDLEEFSHAAHIQNRVASPVFTLIAGNQVDSESPRRWLLVSREMGVPAEEEGSSRWSVDHLFLDQDGIPTIIEVKRASDTRIRREVVGQMLDYAANALVYWPLKEIQDRFSDRCDRGGLDADSEPQAFLGSEINTSDFWSTVKKTSKPAESG